MRKEIAWRTEFKDEHDFQNWAVARLRALKFVVIVTSKSTRGKIQDKSVPDVLVRGNNWGRGSWRGIEFKNPNGWKWSSPEQELAYHESHFYVASSWREVCDAVAIDFEKEIAPK